MPSSPLSKRLQSFILAAAEEPFRVFFPLAVLWSVVAALVWPVRVYWPESFAYPGELHARLMVELFVGGAVVGFLGTAFPRLIGAPHLTVAELLLLLTLHSGAGIAHLLGFPHWGDGMFILLIIVFGLNLSLRLVFREDTPPPGIPLVACGLVAAGAGAVLLMARGLIPFESPWRNLGSLLLYQGFPALVLIGMAPFFFPRFFGMESRHRFDESMSAPRGWWLRVLFSLATGALVIAGFVIEARGAKMAGLLLRAAASAVYLYSELPLHRARRPFTSLSLAAAAAMVFFPAAWIYQAFDPAHSVTARHVFFIGAVSVSILAVATWVILGHSDRTAELKRPGKLLATIFLIVVLVLATRVSADYLPRVQLQHYAYAAIVWVLALILWWKRLDRG